MESLADLPPGYGFGAIYLMRHGETVLDASRRSDGWLDMPLSDAGRLGLITAEQELKTVPLKTIFAPDLKRTIETAEIVASGVLSCPKVKIDDDARTWNLGAIAGTKKRYGRPEVQKLIDAPDTAPMGGESYNDFKGRFLPWFEYAVMKASRVEPVLYVGSGSNLRLIGTEYLGDVEGVDLNEGGLACMHMVGDRWYGEVLIGQDDQDDDIS